MHLFNSIMNYSVVFSAHFLAPPIVAQITFSTMEETAAIDIPVRRAIAHANFIPIDMLFFPNDILLAPLFIE